MRRLIPLVLLLLGCGAGCGAYDPDTRSSHVKREAPRRPQVIALGRTYDGQGGGPQGDSIIEARIRKVGGGGFQLKDAPPGVHFLRVDAQTEVVGAKELRPGMEVLARFEVNGFDAVAKRVEVKDAPPESGRR